MGRLTMLKPRLGAASKPRLKPMRSGDVRIRGSALQAIRERILRRDNGLCQCARCKRDGIPRLATIVDHVQPLWAGGREHDDNRSSISGECHDLKSAHEAACRARGTWVPWDGAARG